MSGDPKKCNLQGSVLRDGVCYLGDAPVLETAAEMKERIDENSADGKETLVFFTANWCKYCKIIKPFVKEGTSNIPSSAKMLVCDASYAYEDPCESVGDTWLPGFETFNSGEPGTVIGQSRLFNYYLAGHQLGLAYSFDSPLSGDVSRFGAGLALNIQTPLMEHDIATQFAATVHLDGDEFKTADIEAKIYLPTIGDLIQHSPVRFLGLYVGTGLNVMDDGSIGMKNSVGAELVRANLMSWLVSAEAGIYQFDPFSRSQEWLPNISLTLGHSL